MGTSNRNRASLAPPLLADKDEWKRTAQNWMQNANRGGIVPTGTVTLASGATSTTVTDARTGKSSHIDFMPTNSNAAQGWKKLLITGQVAGTFVITHTASALTDRTYRYTIMG